MVEMNDNSELLTKEEMEAIYQKLKKETYEFSEQYETSISEKHWNPDRPADRERYFVVQSRERIQEIIAQAQHLKSSTLKDAKIAELQGTIARMIIDNSVLEQGMADKQREIDRIWAGLDKYKISNSTFRGKLSFVISEKEYQALKKQKGGKDG